MSSAVEHLGALAISGTVTPFRGRVSFLRVGAPDRGCFFGFSCNLFLLLLFSGVDWLGIEIITTSAAARFIFDSWPWPYIFGGALVAKINILNVRAMLVASGIEPNPGPNPLVKTLGCLISVFNLGSLITNFENFSKAPGHVLAFSEHSVPPQDRAQARRKLGAAGLNGTFSPLDPELKHPTGGVGVVTRKPFKADHLTPRSPKLANVLQSGRLHFSALSIGMSVPILAFVVYGWTGGRQDATASARTNAIFEAILHELSLRPPCPVFFMGDFNTSLCKLPALHNLVQTGGWCDVGAVAERWGGTNEEPTCFGYNTSTPSRNDFFIANPASVHLIDSFQVVRTSDFSNHSILQIGLIPPCAAPQLSINFVPGSLHDAMAARFFQANKHLDRNKTIQFYHKEFK